MAGTTGLEPATSAVTGYRDLETQAPTGNTKERKVLKTHRRELLLFPVCSRAVNASVPDTKSADGLAPTLKIIRWFEASVRFELTTFGL